MALDVRLGRLQRWMQSVVVHPGSTAEALKGKAAREIPSRRLSDVILPSRTLAPVERIDIYHGMYLLRMHEALVGDYEALAHFLGHRAFLDLVRGYVEKHPSRSYSLNRLGDRLPEYVRSAPGIPRRAFCEDLARLERAAAQAFDAEETPSLTAEAIAAVPERDWERARLRPVASFRLLSFRYPVNAYLQSVREENHDHPSTRRKDTWVAVYRKDYAVRRLDLDQAGHALLADLADGRPLGQAVTRPILRGGRRAPSETALFGWFRMWVSGGVFQSIDVGRHPV